MNREAPRGKTGRILRLSAGWALTLSGLILGPVPIVPGFVLLLPGVALLAAESRVIRGFLRRHREKRLLQRALREAERVGIRFDLEKDSESDRPPDPPPPGDATGSAG